MRIVIDRDQVWERALVIDETGEVCDLYADRVDRPLLYGGVYQGKVIRRLPQKAGALIDIGSVGRFGWQDRNLTAALLRHIGARIDADRDRS